MVGCNDILLLMIAIIFISFVCVIGCIGFHQQSIRDTGYDDAQLQYFLQVNESMTNTEKYQLIQEICNTSYPLRLQYAFHVYPHSREAVWNCECKRRLIKSS